MTGLGEGNQSAKQFVCGGCRNSFMAALLPEAGVIRGRLALSTAWLRPVGGRRGRRRSRRRGDPGRIREAGLSLTPQRGRIISGIRQSAQRGLHPGFILLIGDSKPLRRGGQHCTGCRAGTDQPVHCQRVCLIGICFRGRHWERVGGSCEGVWEGFCHQAIGLMM